MKIIAPLVENALWSWDNFFSKQEFIKSVLINYREQSLIVEFTEGVKITSEEELYSQIRWNSSYQYDVLPPEIIELVQKNGAPDVDIFQFASRIKDPAAQGKIMRHLNSEDIGVIDFPTYIHLPSLPELETLELFIKVGLPPVKAINIIFNFLNISPQIAEAGDEWILNILERHQDINLDELKLNLNVSDQLLLKLANIIAPIKILMHMGYISSEEWDAESKEMVHSPEIADLKRKKIASFIANIGIEKLQQGEIKPHDIIRLPVEALEQFEVGFLSALEGVHIGYYEEWSKISFLAKIFTPEKILQDVINSIPGIYEDDVFVLDQHQLVKKSKILSRLINEYQLDINDFEIYSRFVEEDALYQQHGLKADRMVKVFLNKKWGEKNNWLIEDADSLEQLKNLLDEPELDFDFNKALLQKTRVSYNYITYNEDNTLPKEIVTWLYQAGKIKADCLLTFAAINLDAELFDIAMSDGANLIFSAVDGSGPNTPLSILAEQNKAENAIFIIKKYLKNIFELVEVDELGIPPSWLLNIITIADDPEKILRKLFSEKGCNPKKLISQIFNKYSFQENIPEEIFTQMDMVLKIAKFELEFLTINAYFRFHKILDKYLSSNQILKLLAVGVAYNQEGGELNTNIVADQCSKMLLMLMERGDVSAEYLVHFICRRTSVLSTLFSSKKELSHDVLEVIEYLVAQKENDAKQNFDLELFNVLCPLLRSSQFVKGKHVNYTPSKELLITLYKEGICSSLPLLVCAVWNKDYKMIDDFVINLPHFGVEMFFDDEKISFIDFVINTGDTELLNYFLDNFPQLSRDQKGNIIKLSFVQSTILGIKNVSKDKGELLLKLDGFISWDTFVQEELNQGQNHTILAEFKAIYDHALRFSRGELSDIESKIMMGDLTVEEIHNIVANEGEILKEFVGQFPIIHLALFSRNIDVITDFVKSGANINAFSDSNITIFALADYIGLSLAGSTSRPKKEDSQAIAAKEYTLPELIIAKIDDIDSQSHNGATVMDNLISVLGGNWQKALAKSNDVLFDFYRSDFDYSKFSTQHGAPKIAISSGENLWSTDIFAFARLFAKTHPGFEFYIITPEMVKNSKKYPDLLGQFDGFINPGAGDSYNKRDQVDFAKNDVTLYLSQEKLYQGVISYATQYDVPYVGICAGMQHLILNHGGSLQHNGSCPPQRTVMLKPDNIIYLYSLTASEKDDILGGGNWPQISFKGDTAHSYSGYNLADIKLCGVSCERDLPMIARDGLCLATQFHPEHSYSAAINRVEDKGSEYCLVVKTLDLFGEFVLHQHASRYQGGISPVEYAESLEAELAHLVMANPPQDFDSSKDYAPVVLGEM